MGVIWKDNRTDEQREAAEAHAVERREEWDRHHAANPVYVVVVDSDVRDGR